MTYQEEERTRLRRQLTKQAIALAMQGRWREAVAANQTILEEFPNDIDACNRLGRAYMELGEYALARQSYQKTIALDPYNIIAEKNLGRLSHLGEAAPIPEESLQKVEPQQFIEEIGKAGVVNLYHLASAETLAKMVSGAKVNLKIDGNSLIVENSHGEYLGQVEPRHEQRLIKLIEGGNRYSTAIVSPTPTAVTVIIREEYQDPSQAGRLSFPSKGVEPFRPYVADRMLRRELEYEEALPSENSYTIVGGEIEGEDTELLTEEAPETEEENEE
jgi:tetratricopeptide (TPR) repeat protein